MSSKNIKFGQTHILMGAIAFAIMILYAMYIRRDELMFGIILTGVCLVIDLAALTVIHHNWDIVLKAIRLIELLVYSVYIVYNPSDIKQVVAISYFVLAIRMLEIVFLFEYTDNYARTITIGLMLFPVTIMILLNLIFDQTESDPGNINSVGTIATLSIVVVILSKTSDIFTEWLTHIERRVFEQRRMADNAKEMNETLRIHQQKIRKANEELTVQKLKMELANETINRVNNEIRIQNEVMRCLNSSFDLQSLSEEITRTVVNCTDNIVFCSMLIAPLDKKSEAVYSAEIKSISEDFMKYFSSWAIESGFKNTLNRRIFVDKKLSDSCYDKLTADDRLLSVVTIPIYKGDEAVAVIYCGSDLQDSFDDETDLFNVISAQILLAINNIKLYYEIQQSAITDGLTGLLNRRRLNEIMVRYSNDAIVNRIPLSVALIDIDLFKRFNDTYGHACGDMVLQKLAEILERNVEDNGGIAARYGGEEFVIAALDMNLSEMGVLLEKIKSEIDSAVFDYDGNEIRFRVSMGYTSFPEVSSTPNETLNRADSALYYSKEHGRNLITADGENVTAFFNEREKSDRSLL